MTDFQLRLIEYCDAQEKMRPHAWLADSQMFGYYASMFIAMRHHDRQGNTWTRDAIGAHLARHAGGDTPQD